MSLQIESSVRITVRGMQFAAEVVRYPNTIRGLAAGQNGLRAGEIVHFHAEWLD